MSVNLYKLENELEIIRIQLMKHELALNKMLNMISEYYDSGDILLIYLKDSEIISVDNKENIEYSNGDEFLVVKSDGVMNFIMIDNISYIKLIKK